MRRSSDEDSTTSAGGMLPRSLCPLRAASAPAHATALAGLCFARPPLPAASGAAWSGTRATRPRPRLCWTRPTGAVCHRQAPAPGHAGLQMLCAHKHARARIAVQSLAHAAYRLAARGPRTCIFRMPPPARLSACAATPHPSTNVRSHASIARRTDGRKETAARSDLGPPRAPAFRSCRSNSGMSHGSGESDGVPGSPLTSGTSPSRRCVMCVCVDTDRSQCAPFVPRGTRARVCPFRLRGQGFRV